MRSLWLVLIFLVYGVCSFAQVVPVAPAVIAPPTFLDGVMTFLANSSTLVTGLVVVIEFILRLMPTAKPMSILVPVRYVCNGLGVIFTWLAGVLDKIIVVAQNIK